jgi:hypothetical protein
MRAAGRDRRRCEWVSLRSALAHFANYAGAVQSQEHTKPLHWYVACRLVLEGGFMPEEITPRPPFVVERTGRSQAVRYDPSSAGGGERTVLGGLKTKNIDVVVVKEGIGPVMAVSCKGAIGAFRNLTNRMEEAVGDCTNLHIAYPPMVCGYLFVARANRTEQAALEQIEGGGATPARAVSRNDLAFSAGGEVVDGLIRFHAALRALANRRGIRNDVSRYEAVALALVGTGSAAGDILGEFPPGDSSLRTERFFETLYAHYDERYVYGAPALSSVTSRREWSENSPAFDPSGTRCFDPSGT